MNSISIIFWFVIVFFINYLSNISYCPYLVIIIIIFQFINALVFYRLKSEDRNNNKINNLLNLSNENI